MTLLAQNGHGSISLDVHNEKVYRRASDKIEPLMNIMVDERAHKRINDVLFDGEQEPIKGVFGVKPGTTHQYFEQEAS